MEKRDSRFTGQRMLNRQEEKKDTIHGWSKGGQRAGVAEEVFSNLV